MKKIIKNNYKIIFLIIGALFIFQVFFRYEYRSNNNHYITRIDRLTGNIKAIKIEKKRITFDDINLDVK
ncbi:MAG: hypothetical protein ACD_20C00283G0004 [uncultured bacterium]|nr:MAG: hypothetical protein ACD_20C00283G0004 [uncultured bacterium]HBH18244.1 hypothetical protein [Cyanobacteria bacterium UBA9579]